MATKILKAKITADARKFRSEMQKVRSTVTKTATFISSAMATGVGLALIKATNDAIKFEKAMRNVNTIAQLSEQDFKKMSSQVLDLSASIGTDLIDTTLGLYQTLSRQIPANNAIEFMQIASESAIGGMSDVESSVKVLTSVLKAFGLGTMADVRDIADAMFVTVKDGAVTFQELTHSLGLVAPIAAKTGVTITDLMTAIAAISVQGLTAEQTMTALKGSINGLLSPTPALKAELSKMLKVANASDWRDLGFLKTMELLEKQVGGNSEKMKELFPNIRGLLGAFTLTGQSVGLVNKVLADMNNRVGASKKAYLEMEKATSRSMAKLSASVTKMGVLVGNEILPLVEKSARELIAQIKELADSGELQKWGKEAASILSELVPMLVSLIKFVTSNAKTLIYLGFSIKGLDLMAKTYTSLLLIQTGLIAIKQQKIIGIGADVASIGTSAASSVIKVNLLKASLLAIKSLGAIAIVIGVKYAISNAKDLNKALDEQAKAIERTGATGSGTRANGILKPLAEFLAPYFDVDVPQTIGETLSLEAAKLPKKTNGGVKLTPADIAKKQAEIQKALKAEKQRTDTITDLKGQNDDLDKIAQDILVKLKNVQASQEEIANEKRKEAELAKFQNKLNNNINNINTEIATIDSKRKLIHDKLLNAENDLLAIQKRVGAKNVKQLAGMNANQRINHARDLKKQAREDARLANRLKRLQERDKKGLHITKKGRDLLDLLDKGNKVKQLKGQAKNLKADAIALEDKLSKIRETNQKALEKWKLGKEREAEDEKLARLKLQQRTFIKELNQVRLKMEFNSDALSSFGDNYVDRDYTSVFSKISNSLSNIENKNILGAWASAKEA